MADLIASAESWFETQRRRHLSSQVEYRPAGGLSRYCAATLVVGRWERIDSSGQLVRYETRDFFIGRDELPQDPRRGDKIVVTEDGVAQTYEVAIPDGAASPWRWGDRSQKVRRIHTISQTSAPAIPPAFLVRFFGASRAPAITDQQIQAGLTPELASAVGLTKSITCDAAYIYVVVPAAWVEDEPEFRVNGLATSAFESTTRSITFTGQAATQYTIYRSTYAVTGTVSLEVA